MALQENDILFIESGFISGMNDLHNKLYLEILPALKPGVLIHFHDIFWPFEYPKKAAWEYEFANEVYLLRAFLQFNPHYEFLLFYSYLYEIHQSWIQQYIPEPLRKPGSSLWLRKI